jgi:D-tagatose-1,6-bisphosphate aldolase subunit GatZ/KbaZ
MFTSVILGCSEEKHRPIASNQEKNLSNADRILQKDLSLQPAWRPDQTEPANRLLEIVRHNRGSVAEGVYSVCSAHPAVIEAACRLAVENDSLLCIESTSNQVNQFGGYTGQTPQQFAAAISSAVRSAGLPANNVVLGGDHLGPFPWRTEPEDSAMEKACELVRTSVLAGYRKIHLDASMTCASDGDAPLSDQTVAERAAILCQAAERSSDELPENSPRVLYVIGTEVPAPGGESLSGGPPTATSIDGVRNTLEAFRVAFDARGLSAAWERVIGLVVQPGVEFGDDVIFDYDRAKASTLAANLPAHPALVYEAHSTDYQSPKALVEMVEDHFAILKVGPWLTFAFREAVFALGAIEREMLAGKRGRNVSQVREALDSAMLQNPSYWRSYYQGDEDQLRFSRAYSYSDRCRYYWPQASVQKELVQLIDNLSAQSLPLTLLSQFMPMEYAAVRAGQLTIQPHAIILYHIQNVLRIYAAACRS